MLTTMSPEWKVLPWEDLSIAHIDTVVRINYEVSSRYDIGTIELISHSDRGLLTVHLRGGATCEYSLSAKRGFGEPTLWVLA